MGAEAIRRISFELYSYGKLYDISYEKDTH